MTIKSAPMSLIRKEGLKKKELEKGRGGAEHQHQQLQQMNTKLPE